MFVSNVRRFVQTYVLPYGRVFGFGIPIPPILLVFHVAFGFLRCGTVIPLTMYHVLKLNSRHSQTHHKCTVAD